MKSLVLFSYRQPLKGNKIRWGVLESSRNVLKLPLSASTIDGPYRRYDKSFARSNHIDTVVTMGGVKSFYRERRNWGVKIPLIGSMVKPFLKS